MTGQAMPLAEATQVTLQCARENKIPIKTALFDATPHISNLLRLLYEQGYVFLAINGDPDQAAKVAAELSAGARADI